MDVFWVAHAGVDPAALLARYPGRWRMLHLKDLRRGAKRDATGAAPATDDVPVGQGEVHWPAVLSEARRAGVEYYFIEDESVAPLENVPTSLRYLSRFHL
jgi:sugar phosphate isomerase/epimerase